MKDATEMKRIAPLGSLRSFFRDLGQKKGEVLVREPGARMFGAPLDAHIEADRQWEYAALSQVVYDKAEASKTNARRGVPLKPDYSKRSFDPNRALAEGGWIICEQFPGEELKPKLTKRHLRVEVWRKNDPTEVAVVFAGTVATNIEDWISNLRWFLPKHRDEYTELVSAFIPEFAKIFEQCFPENPPVIHATGHSLGGGLAQQFAYALPNHIKFDQPKVIQVFAFDPSPVTGYYSVGKTLRARNTMGMKIDRIFERGEVLATARSLVALIYPPSTINPAIRAVRYDFYGVQNPIRAHSIARLAEGLYEARTRGEKLT
jgi:hypothetical protein